VSGKSKVSKEAALSSTEWYRKAIEVQQSQAAQKAAEKGLL
jgi:hypothetical protein